MSRPLPCCSGGCPGATKPKSPLAVVGWTCAGVPHAAAGVSAGVGPWRGFHCGRGSCGPPPGGRAPCLQMAGVESSAGPCTSCAPAHLMFTCVCTCTCVCVCARAERLGDPACSPPRARCPFRGGASPAHPGATHPCMPLPAAHSLSLGTSRGHSPCPRLILHPPLTAVQFFLCTNWCPRPSR